MTTPHSNPFVLPGFGQSGETSANPIMASMEMMRQAWQSLAEQGGFGAPSMATTVSVEALDQRITDLRAVENWLRMNLTVLASTIQGLEVQRATVSTFKSFMNNASAMAGQDAADAASAASGFDSEQAVAATQAWWELLRKQFDSLAAATAASMPADAPAATADASGAGAAATARAQAGAASPRKAASGKAGARAKSVKPAKSPNGPRSGR